MYVLLALVFCLLFQVPSPSAKSEKPVVQNRKAPNKTEHSTKAAPFVTPDAAVSTPMSQPPPTQQQNAHQGEPDHRVYRVDVVSQKFDWLYLAYVVITAIAAFVAWRALIAIRGQANLMNEQLIEMKEARRQTNELIKAASEQVTEMKKAGEQTVQLIATAEKTAEASRINAEAAREDVEMFINRERARIRIEVNPLLIPSGHLMGHTVTYKILFYGFTDAFITSSSHYAIATKENEPFIESDFYMRIFDMNIPAVITPSAKLPEPFQFIFPEITLAQTTIDAINEGKIFVHFFGFIKYKDVFDRERETRFCYTWDADANPPIPRIKRAQWLKSGPPNANRET